MIPVEQGRAVFSAGVQDTASFEISSKDAAHIQTILRDTLYSDKVLAVLREYAANAWDANRMIGKGDIPINITLPTQLEPVLKIRDSGPGLSRHDVLEVYNKYGASTKRDSNSAVGMLGIGSKSGFAYSDTFTIVSYHGGKVSTYVAVIDESEKGRVDLLHEQPCDESETGVEIQIPVSTYDIREFERKAQALFAFFAPRPVINTELPAIPPGKDFEGLGRVLDGQDGYSRPLDHGWTAVMGCIPYRINLNQLVGVSKYAARMGGILSFDIGTLQVAASREELKYGETTKAALVERINAIIDKYVEFLLEGVDSLSQWERRLRIRKINEMYLPVPVDLKNYSDSYVNFDTDPAFVLKRCNYKGKLELSSGIQVSKDTRLVFKNDKRSLQGFKIQSSDVVVDPKDDKTARINLANAITKHRLQGIPIVDISNLPWTKPPTTPRQVDATRAKAQCLVFDPKVNSHRKSERWTPANRKPLDTDVFVVLNAYQADDMDDFYALYQRDQRVLELVGAAMPQIIGYRNSQERPVVKSSLKGTSYSQWRKDGIVKILLSNKQVAEAAVAKAWSNVDTYTTAYRKEKNLMAALEDGHPAKEFYLKAYQGYEKYYGGSNKLGPALSRVIESWKESEPEMAWKELLRLYPLFNIFDRPSVVWAAANYDEWIEYIKIMDAQRRNVQQDSQEKMEVA